MMAGWSLTPKSAAPQRTLPIMASEEKPVLKRSEGLPTRPRGPAPDGVAIEWPGFTVSMSLLHIDPLWALPPVCSWLCFIPFFFNFNLEEQGYCGVTSGKDNSLKS